MASCTLYVSFILRWIQWTYAFSAYTNKWNEVRRAHAIKGNAGCSGFVGKAGEIYLKI